MTNLIKSFSYSSVFVDFQECGYRYKLKYIDKRPYFRNSIDTIFGKLIHERIQNILLNKETTKEATSLFNRKWTIFYKLYKKYLNAEKSINYHTSGLKIILAVEKAFINYRTLSVEEELKFQLNESQVFKGFIDLILVDKNDENNLVIVDLKTAISAFMFKEYLTTHKTYQLVLYKHYYSVIKQFPVKNISLKFVVLEKNPKSKKPISFIDVPCGERKINNCLKILNNSINFINENKFLKNKSNCFKVGTEIQCPFYNTEWCS